MFSSATFKLQNRNNGTIHINPFQGAVPLCKSSNPCMRDRLTCRPYTYNEGHDRYAINWNICTIGLTIIIVMLATQESNFLTRRKSLSIL